MENDSFEVELRRRLEQKDLQDKFARLIFKKLQGQISIQVEDPGPGFNWKNYLEFNIDRATDSHGRGIALAKALSFDSLVYSEQGNCVTAIINTENYE